MYDFDTACPQIFCGARNRWIFYPGVVTRWFTKPEDQQRAGIFIEDLIRAPAEPGNYRPLVRVGEEDCVEPEFGTTVDIDGLGMSAGARSHLLQLDDFVDDPPEADPGPVPNRKEVFEHLKGKVVSLKAELRSDEEGILKWYFENWLSCGADWDKWLDKVKFRP